jgi:hypothetical protein
MDHVERHTKQIGGGGFKKAVEIDESKFGKGKYSRGHHVKEQWVFGGVERVSGRNVLVAPCQDGAAETMIYSIKQEIHPGTTISDF